MECSDYARRGGPLSSPVGLVARQSDILASTQNIRSLILQGRGGLAAERQLSANVLRVFLRDCHSRRFPSDGGVENVHNRLRHHYIRSKKMCLNE